ncbi:basic helix-loop-helix ARNT-like protein 1 isoform X1 [Euwallacea fornicatus]|uniref:basic helix-loop-helix ARNT-like protein 1 isoform X1 n=1 Tax=Euwallacea fornicatus TaxID=995702 RepID=UPI00338D6CB0
MVNGVKGGPGESKDGYANMTNGVGVSSYVPNGYVSNGYIPNGQAFHQYQQYQEYAMMRQGSAGFSTPMGEHQRRVAAMHEVANGRPNNNNLFFPGTQARYCGPNSTREQRNRAEKQRRDKLNSFIHQLAQLLALSDRSAKRQDKTSILRLSANELRLYQFCVNMRKSKQFSGMKLPSYVDQNLLEDLLADDMDGFMLIVMSNGKVVFVSYRVESVLGYAQIDLMGQFLCSIVAPEDHERLRSQLASEGEILTNWKRDFNIKMRRAGPKSEAPQYEVIRLMGVSKSLIPEGSDEGGEVSPSTSTAVVHSSALSPKILIFFAKLCRPKPLTEKLMNRPREEYVTRHLLDGKIVWCDQRISFIAGYMTEEVQGHSAFHYMHKDDVRFAMMALRQMYDKGETFGSSCYRLKGTNGEFVYLRTFGRLEVDDKGVVESFICTNVLVDEREGKYFLSEMRRLYSSVLDESLVKLQHSSSGGAKIVEVNEEEEEEEEKEKVSVGKIKSTVVPSLLTEKVDTTEDPQTLDLAINELMQNLPPAESEEERPQLLDTPPSVVEYFSPSVSNSSPGSIVSEIRMSLKRDSTDSIDFVKRQRLTSLDSEPPLLSPIVPSPERGLGNGFADTPPLLEEVIAREIFHPHGNVDNCRRKRSLDHGVSEANCGPYLRKEREEQPGTMKW